MTELVVIRTMLKVKVLENLPIDDSISLQTLAHATEAQESLLGSTDRTEDITRN